MVVPPDRPLYALLTYQAMVPTWSFLLPLTSGLLGWHSVHMGLTPRGQVALFGLPFLETAPMELMGVSSLDYMLISKAIQGPGSHLGKADTWQS